MPIAHQIACMECGGDAYLLQAIGDDDVLMAGDIVAYRCPDCGERWDVVLDTADVVDDREPD